MANMLRLLSSFLIFMKSFKMTRISRLRRLLHLFTFLCLFVLAYLMYEVIFGDYNQLLMKRRGGPAPVVDYVCKRNNVEIDQSFFETSSFTNIKIDGELRTEDKVLLLVETQYSGLGQQLITVMNAMKLQYKAQVVGKTLPSLTTVGAKGRYAVVIFENMYRYLNMDQWNRQILDKYCKDYGAGLIAFMPTRQDLHFDRAKVRGFPLNVYQNLHLVQLNLSTNADLATNDGPRENGTNSENEPSMSFFYMTKEGGTLNRDDLAGSRNGWVGFEPRHGTYNSIVSATAQFPSRRDSPTVSEFATERTVEENNVDVSLVILDNGKWDGIRRIFFGHDFGALWLMKLIFVDALRFISNGRLALSLTRYVQIDIDDIFVGEKGYKLTAADVQALIETQKRLRGLIPGFTFNLGFSGKFFRRGSRSEMEGDNMLIEHSNKFWWFPHQWRHTKPHKWNETQLESFMTLNKQFAEEYKLPVKWRYAVSPHHSGVYPAHEPLYEAWKKVWGIRVTSTEQYPHLKPAALRRGFIHNEIMVLPRQTCGLYTHTVFMNVFPGGRARLDQSIKGGELFYTFIFNPFLIFMTHQANYAHDRLAPYTFETVVLFLRCWTNLQLKAIPPLRMAEKYFRHYPEERDPVLGNPCLDKRHMAIWANDKNCDQLPKALILGPQKTGSTALYTFLKRHPSVRSNLPSPSTFEELQFFNGKSYRHGLDWYMSFFPPDDHNSSVFYFEKSATYFDSELAPKRVKALLPKAKLVVILISAAKRSYSWYQHVRAHGDKTALAYDFGIVINANEDSSREMWQLRQHCLRPGHYAEHIERWLLHFPSKQLLLVDGDRLKSEPIQVMTSIQEFLELEQRVNYDKLLRYSTTKGFYCVVNDDEKTQCLGRGKGRHYEPMRNDSRRYLLNYYRPHNIALHRLLTRLGYATPRWLQQELEETL